MIRAIIVVLAVSAMLAGCGGGGQDDAKSSTTTAPSATAASQKSTDPPDWMRKLGLAGNAVTKEPSIEGHEIYKDVDKRIVYVEDCAFGDRITAEGQPYGPSRRDADFNYTEGYTLVCSNR